MCLSGTGSIYRQSCPVSLPDLFLFSFVLRIAGSAAELVGLFHYVRLEITGKWPWLVSEPILGISQRLCNASDRPIFTPVQSDC
jgi:hypothetical protein